MAVKKTPVTERTSAPDARLNIRIAEDMLDALGAWARADGRTTEALGRYLIEQAVMARGDRLALTRR